jgi:hypothetical protein
VKDNVKTFKPCLKAICGLLKNTNSKSMSLLSDVFTHIRANYAFSSESSEKQDEHCEFLQFSSEFYGF